MHLTSLSSGAELVNLGRCWFQGLQGYHASSLIVLWPVCAVATSLLHYDSGTAAARLCPRPACPRLVQVSGFASCQASFR